MLADTEGLVLTPITSRRKTLSYPRGAISYFTVSAGCYKQASPAEGSAVWKGTECAKGRPQEDPHGRKVCLKCADRRILRRSRFRIIPGSADRELCIRRALVCELFADTHTAQREWSANVAPRLHRIARTKFRAIVLPQKATETQVSSQEARLGIPKIRLPGMLTLLKFQIRPSCRLPRGVRGNFGERVVVTFLSLSRWSENPWKKCNAFNSELHVPTVVSWSFRAFESSL